MWIGQALGLTSRSCSEHMISKKPCKGAGPTSLLLASLSILSERFNEGGVVYKGSWVRVEVEATSQPYGGAYLNQAELMVKSNCRQREPAVNTNVPSAISTTHNVDEDWASHYVPNLSLSDCLSHENEDSLRDASVRESSEIIQGGPCLSCRCRPCYILSVDPHNASNWSMVLLFFLSPGLAAVPVVSVRLAQ